MIYLKTYFYTEHEIKFLILNLLEAYDYIDKFIIMEYNVHHTGLPRDYIFENYIDKFPKDKLDKILYIKSDIKKLTVKAFNNENKIHNINEPIMRGHFVKEINIQDDDIIFSVDADEIIYSHMYPEIIEYVQKNDKCKLKLRQFFWKINYLWENNVFIAPTVAKYKVYKNKYPSQWRYDGPLYKKFAGCHFSWCMTVDEMIFKLYTYSHPKYRNFANKEILENAIKNKTYPFKSNVNIKIQELDLNDDRLPKSINKVHEINSNNR